MTPAVLERFQQVILGLLGFHSDPARRDYLQQVLLRRAAAYHASPERYLQLLDNLTESERDALAAEVTVSETYFFRHLDQLGVLSTWGAQAGRQLRILCAGCSSGEEPYSIAMLMHGQSPEITAVDVNPVALHKAQRGRYTAWSLRETSQTLQQRWFRAEGREFVLDPEIVGAVRFLQGNLLDANAEFWRPGYYDVILCRNVIMYFDPEVARSVVSRLQQSLATDGHLMLGHAESLRGLNDDLQLRHSDEMFSYQNSAAPAAAAEAVDWVGDIERRTQRIDALTRHDVAPTPPDLSRVVELLRRERFDDALALVNTMPATADHVALLKAALLTHAGRWIEAQEICSTLHGAGKHHLLALCKEGTGDMPGALYHNQMAALADPEFAMPRLRMGLLHRRLRHAELARRELTTAAGLLLQEEESRLLLYGGGFSRQTLLTLCQAELAACDHA